MYLSYIQHSRVFKKLFAFKCMFNSKKLVNEDGEKVSEVGH